MPNVVGVRVERVGATVAGCEVFEKLDGRAGRGTHAGDVQPRAEDVVEVLLLRPVVLALAAAVSSRRMKNNLTTGFKPRVQRHATIDVEIRAGNVIGVIAREPNGSLG